MSTNTTSPKNNVQPRSQESGRARTYLRTFKPESEEVQTKDNEQQSQAAMPAYGEHEGLQMKGEETTPMQASEAEIQPMAPLRTKEDNDLMQTYQDLVDQPSEGVQMMQGLMQRMDEEEVQTKEDPSIQKQETESIQPQLKVGAPNDKYEQEANKVADAVVRSGGLSPEEEVQEEEVQLMEPEQELQQMAAGGSEDSGGAGSDDSDEIKTRRKGGNSESDVSPTFMKQLANSTGQLLSPAVAQKMGALMHADFSNIYIHTDKASIAMNKELGSLAFAKGNHVYFNEGQYNPGSEQGVWLLAHELTHTIQQGAAGKLRTKGDEEAVQMNQEAPVQNMEEEAKTAATPPKPKTAIDITYKLDLSPEWADYLDSKTQVVQEELPVKIGDKYEGNIFISRKNANAEGQQAKYELYRKGKDVNRYLTVKGMKFLDPLRQAGVEPILVLNNFGDSQQTSAFLSVKMGGDPLVADAFGFFKGLNAKLEKMKFSGIEPIKGFETATNKFENGRLDFSVNGLTTVVDGFLEAGGGMGIVGDKFTVNLMAEVDVAGLAQGQFEMKLAETGELSGKGKIAADIGNVNAEISIEYLEGVVTIQGTGTINSEKFSGTVNLLVTDEDRSKSMMQAALGTDSMEAEKSKETKAAPEPKTKSKKNQVLAGWGEVTANITPWLAGTAKVSLDHRGHVTIVGEVNVQNEVELMEERSKKTDLFQFEIRAGYGVPLVGQVFLFASIGMFVKAGFGPLVLKDVGLEGTYSTDPDILQKFSITGTLGINAFAILGLQAEAGVGLTLLGHDIKAGVNVTAAAGLRAYAEATPTLEYIEKQAEGGKVGDAHLKGHFEAAAQLFLQLSGALFYELDSPWWSPAPDGREEYPLGEVQYPIGESMAIGGDVDWLVGSPDIPEIAFSPVEFDPDKFTSDIMGDPPAKKKGKSDQNPKGKWDDGKKKDDKSKNLETKDGKGLPKSKKKEENLKDLPDNQKYLRALDEISKLADSKSKPTKKVVEAKAKKVKNKYGIDKISPKFSGDEATISVKHKKENNKKNLVKIPLMTEAERVKLLHTAMADLQAQLTSKAGDDNKITEAETLDVVKAWDTKHDVIENARAIDGGTTWDVKVDIGDKDGTEKGRAKVESENVEESEGTQKHKMVGDKITKELEAPSKKEDLSFEQLYKEKTTLANSLEKKYKGQLEPNVNLTITYGTKSEEKKDNRIDFTITIAPNDHIVIATVSGDLNINLEEMKVVSADSKDSRAIIQVYQKKLGELTSLNPQAEQGYLGQVISAVGDESTAHKLPEKYKNEAFENKEDASKRFSLVLGLNLFDDIRGENKEKIKNSKNKFESPGYPLGLIGLLWTPNWQIVEGSEKDAKKKIISANKLKAKVNEISDSKKKEEITKNIVTEENSKIKKPASSHIPFGKLRDKVNNHSYTSKFSANLKENVKNVYVHLGDADVISLKVNGGESIDINQIFGDFDKPLFSVYDKIIKNHKGDKKPAIVSGGYRFTVDQTLDNGDQLRAIANLIDQEFRQAIAKIDPTILYFPEPNTLVKLNGDKLEVSFGIGKNESKTFMTSLLKKREKDGKPLSKEDIAYLVAAGIITKGERFYAKQGKKKITGQIIYHTVEGQQGKDEMTLAQFRGLFKADQMHATKSKVTSSISKNEHYCPTGNKEDIMGFKKILEKLYNSGFPHTDLLGQHMKNNKAWLNFKQNINAYEVPEFDSKTIVEFYKSKNMFPGLEQQKAVSILDLLENGSKGVLKAIKEIIKNIDLVK